MKKKNVFVRLPSILLCAVLLLTFLTLSLPVSADIGPKPSVHIVFENMEDATCYVTLLSKTSSTGPFSVWDGEEKHLHDNYGVDDAIVRAFLEYEDADGYYFLQYVCKLGDDHEFVWDYYPPTDFKILLYFPDNGAFLVSGNHYERYAFDTYYTVDMQEASLDSVVYDDQKSTDQRLSDDMQETSFDSVVYDDQKSTDQRLSAYRSYEFRTEIGALIVRILLTVAIEMIIALFFGYRRGKQLLLLLGVNAVTQVLLNLLINIFGLVSGGKYVLVYALAECAVTGIEALLYAWLLDRIGNVHVQKKVRRAVLYAVVANISSFGIGIVISWVLPQFF